MERKQCKRTLALKQKLLLKFLSGEELQKAKAGGSGPWVSAGYCNLRAQDGPKALNTTKTVNYGRVRASGAYLICLQAGLSWSALGWQVGGCRSLVVLVLGFRASCFWSGLQGFMFLEWASGLHVFGVVWVKAMTQSWRLTSESIKHPTCLCLHPTCEPQGLWQRLLLRLRQDRMTLCTARHQFLRRLQHSWHGDVGLSEKPCRCFTKALAQLLS